MTAYDLFAEVYDRHWGDASLRFMPALERAGLFKLPRGSEILDLCCGPGRTARRLTDAGFRVTGIDSSQRMIELARRNAPEGTFIAGTAATFSLDQSFDAVVCLYDSINHLLSLDEVQEVFARVYACLRPGGVFFFDVNTALKYEAHWAGNFDVTDDLGTLRVVCSYSPQTRRAGFEGQWIPAAGIDPANDSTAAFHIAETWYGLDELSDSLAAAGFEECARYVVQPEGKELEAADRVLFAVPKPAVP
jgi:SAM-dependent methyltransferase